MKFVKLSRYASSLVSNIRDEMSRFLTGIIGDLEKYRSAMLHDNMDLSRLMVHVLQVKDSRKKRGICDARRLKPHDQVGLSNGGNRNNFGIHEHHFRTTQECINKLGKYEMQPVNGKYIVPDRPGLGQELSDFAIETALMHTEVTDYVAAAQ